MKITIPFSLIIIALAAAYFLKPSLADHQAAAKAWFEQTQSDAAAKLNLGDLFAAGAASAFETGTYQDQYVFSRYIVTLNDKPYLQCLGYFKRVSCSRAEQKTGSAPAN